MIGREKLWIKCDCKICKAACKNRVCWGTPEEIQLLIDAGFGKSLMVDWWEVFGDENIEIVAPAIVDHEGCVCPDSPRGRCTFLNEADLCILHDKGLKPTEGCLSHHDMPNEAVYELHRKTAMAWDNEEARALVKKWERKYLNKS